jgi:hypothetical protein
LMLRSGGRPVKGGGASGSDGDESSAAAGGCYSRGWRRGKRHWQ